MNKLLEGQISFAGMHDALKAVSMLKNVKNGVLRISSQDSSGLIGVFCGRFITGAVVTLTGETGHVALRKLLAAGDGSFAYMDGEEDVVQELKQNLAVDIAQLLEATELKDPTALSDDSLTGMTANEDQMKLFDTNVVIVPSNDSERIDRINRTYDRIMSLSEHEKAAAEGGSAVIATDSGAEGDFASDAEYAKQRRPVANPSQPPRLEPAENLQGRPPIPSWDVPYEPPRQEEPAAPVAEFNRLKKWNRQADTYKMITVFCLLAVTAVVLWLSWPQITAYVQKSTQPETAPPVTTPAPQPAPPSQPSGHRRRR